MEKNVLGIFSAADIDGITALIGKMEESPYDYLKIEGDGVKIVISKNGLDDSPQVSVTRAEPVAASAPAAVQPPVSAPAAAVEPAPAAAPVPVADTAEEPGVYIIKSPSYGLFYAQSEPTAPPYIKVGDRLQKGDTIGLVEIMKTFSAIVSEEDGEVIAIHVRNEDILEPGQPLVSVRL